MVTRADRSRPGRIRPASPQLETARLATRQRLASRLPDRYLEPMLVACEKGLGALSSTFDSVQPPDTRAADALRAGLDELLQDASGAVGDARIAQRRGNLA